MNKQQEALKLALGELQAGKVGNAMQILREALAEQPAQQQEPVAVARVDDLERGGRVRALAMGLGLDQPLFTSPPAQQQEPVAWRWTESNGQHWFDWRTDWTHHDRAKAMGFAIEYAYTSPPASKPWVGLTDEEMKACTQSPFVVENYRAIEAKLREKNT